MAEPTATTAPANGAPAGAPPTPSPAPAAAPSPAPVASPPKPAAAAPPAPAAGTPPATSAPAPADRPPPANEGVPWPKWREAISANKRLKEQVDTLTERITKEYEPVKAKMAELEQQLQQAGSLREQHELLMWALDNHPDLRDALYQRLGTTPPPATARPGLARPPARPAAPAPGTSLDPEVRKLIDENRQLMAQMREQGETQARATAQAQFNATVGGIVDRFLVERKYDGTAELYPQHTLRQDVLDFLASEGERLEGGGTIEDVPVLLNRWYARTEAMRGLWLKDYIPGKAADGAVPASIPGGGAPVEIKDKPLPLSDPNFRAQIKALMRQGAGAA